MEKLREVEEWRKSFFIECFVQSVSSSFPTYYLFVFRVISLSNWSSQPVRKTKEKFPVARVEGRKKLPFSSGLSNNGEKWFSGGELDEEK